MLNGDEFTKFRDEYIFPTAVGFFKPRPGGFVTAGSGTFASIGEVRGILTCGHVIEAIEDSKRVDLALFGVRRAQRFLPLNVKEHCSAVTVGRVETANGPDLGFLKLPPTFASDISHLVTFKNLDRGRVDAFAAEEPGHYVVDVVTGVVGEWTKEVQDGLFTVKALMSVGQFAADRIVREGNDFFRFKPIPDEGFQPPDNYKGTSGGGLWRIYPAQRPEDKTQYRLIGVAFHQTGDPETREIICHGPLSIYESLMRLAWDKWPEAREA